MRSSRPAQTRTATTDPAESGAPAGHGAVSVHLGDAGLKLNGFVFWLCGNWRGTEDSCRVWSFLDRDTEVYAVLTKLKENLSASATNAAESRCEQLCEAEKSPPQAKPIEHDTRSVSWT